MDKAEIDYWCSEYPEFTREEVIDLLEAVELDIQEEKQQQQ